MSRRRKDLPVRRPLQSASRNRQLRSLRHRVGHPLAADEPALHDYRLRPGVNHIKLFAAVFYKCCQVSTALSNFYPQPQILIRLGWKGLPRKNTLAYYKNL